MTGSQDEPGPWTTASQPGNCAMCGSHWEPGATVRHHPGAGGLVCIACGQPEDEVPGVLDQLNGHRPASP